MGLVSVQPSQIDKRGSDCSLIVSLGWIGPVLVQRLLIGPRQGTEPSVTTHVEGDQREGCRLVMACVYCGAQSFRWVEV